MFDILGILVYMNIFLGSEESRSHLRMIIWMILSAKEDHFWVLMGIVCSSWVSINAGTSKRSLICPTGKETLGYVMDANTMVSRYPVKMTVEEPLSNFGVFCLSIHF